MSGLEAYHFLRPWWLLAIPAALWIWWLVRRRAGSREQTATILAPHLQEALTVNRQKNRRLLPVDGFCLVLCLTGIAGAGPTWSQQPSPWFAETAPLIIALEVSDSMRSNDLQPTRLDRARFKILDLLASRTGARTGLIAYSGSAHVVVPPTKDTNVVKTFLESLDPAMMPTIGSKAEMALPVGMELLADQATISTLLFVNDGFDETDIPAFEAFSEHAEKPALVAWIVGTDAGGVALMPDGTPALSPTGGRIETTIDTSNIRRIAEAGGMEVVRAETGESDIRQILRNIESNLKQAPDPIARWEDRGWMALWPVLIICLLSFRKGWTQQF